MIVNPLTPTIKIVKTNSPKEEEIEIIWQTWKEAAIVALVLAVSAYFITFLQLVQYPIQDWGCFLFDSIKFLGSAAFSNFISLTGLTALAKTRYKKKEKP